MRIACWNVNSIRVRLPQVLHWCEEVAPDVLLLQEIKCQAEAFPKLSFKQRGYSYQEIVGEKSYHGVALLSKYEGSDLVLRLPGEQESDTQARYVQANLCGIRMASVYVPHGNPLGSKKYAFKLQWLERLVQHTKSLISSREPFLFGGDFNIIPTSSDVYDAREWFDDALFTLEVRAFFRRLIFCGLTDAYRVYHDKSNSPYTFWDYKKQRWKYDQGLRIDHFLLSPQVTDRLQECTVDRRPRGYTNPSDHTPLLLTLQD